MSSKAKGRKTSATQKETKEAPEEGVTRAKPMKPAGRIPEASVSSRHGIGMITRKGRGFSNGELSGAGIPFNLARAWSVPVDARRRSVIDPNVAALKKWYGSAPKPEPAPKPKAKPTQRAPRKKTTKKKED